MKFQTKYGVLFLIAAVLVSACAGVVGEAGEQGAAGEKGATGAASLVRVDVEGEGDNCPGGGLAVRSGVDADEDGALSNEEVTATKYLCHGTPGEKAAKALVRLDPEEAGENCAFGGTAVRSGLDLDADDELSDEEITATSYVCSSFGHNEGDTLEGDVVVTRALDVSALRGVRRVTGRLMFAGPDVSSVELPNLEQVDGDLRFEGTNAAKVHLPALRSAKTVFFAGNGKLTSLQLGSLAEVEQHVEVYAHPLLETVTLGALKSVGDTVRVAGNEALTSFSADALVSVKRLEILSQPLLESLSLKVLVSAHAVMVSGNSKLTSLRLDSLASIDADDVVPGFFQVAGNALLESLSLESLGSVDGTLNVAGNTALATAAFSSLEAIKELTVNGNPELRALTLSALTAVDAFVVTGNPKLAQCELDAVVDQLEEAPLSTSFSGNDEDAVCDPA